MNHMKQSMQIILTACFALGAWTAAAQDFDAIYSTLIGPSPSDLYVLARATQPAQIHYLGPDGSLNSIDTNAAAGIPGWREALLPQPTHAYAGFTVSGADTLVVPIFFPDAQGGPETSSSLPVESDPQGDHLFSLDNLDILSTRIAFSETKIHYFIKCNTMTYPVSSGLTFYSYMGIFTETDAAQGSNPIVFAMMNTVDAPGIISPGLYKIVGTGMSDLINIGDITVEVDQVAGVLILTCELADLLADPDFAAWFDPSYPLLATLAMTSRITLSAGNLISDTTAGSQALLLPQPLNFANDNPPQVYEPVFSWEDGFLDVSVMYADADQNPAWALRVHIDGGGFVPLYPQNFAGYEGPVSFSAQVIMCPENWSTATFEVVNGGVGYTFDFANPNVAVSDETAAITALKAYPNPFCDRVTLNGISGQKVRLFNLRGQLLRELLLTDRISELELTDLPAGIYLLNQGKETQRLLKMP